MMKSFFKSLFVMAIFIFALIALFMPNPLHVDDRLVYVSGTMEKMIKPDIYIINGEKVKIWGVTPNNAANDLAQIEAVAAQITAEDNPDAEKSHLVNATDAVKMRVASLKYTNLHCFKKGDAHGETPVMRCYTQNMKDFATCLLGRGVVQPAAGLHMANYNMIHKAAAKGKSAKWQACH